MLSIYVLYGHYEHFTYWYGYVHFTYPYLAMLQLHFTFVAREITHVAAQSVHKYIWRIKWARGERNEWLGRLNSHPPNCELCLTSGLPTHWRACKLPHCAIDPDVTFWYDYLSPSWMYREEGVLSLGDTQHEMSLDVGLLKEIITGKKRILGRSQENCYFQERNSTNHFLLRRRRWHSNSTWNWFHVFIYKRLFSFCYWQGILSTHPLLSTLC